MNGLMTSLQYSTDHSSLVSWKSSSFTRLSIPSSSNQVQPAIPATNLAIGGEFCLINSESSEYFFEQMQCVTMGWQKEKLRIGASKNDRQKWKLEVQPSCCLHLKLPREKKAF